MADITPLFKATVKTIKTRNKARGTDKGPDKSILKSRKKSEFSQHANRLVNGITKLKEFLLQHRKDYVNVNSHMNEGESSLTDAQRDQIDADAQMFIRMCSDGIKTFKDQGNNDKVVHQVREHRAGVCVLMEGYLKVVCHIYSEQRAVRVKRVVDRKRIARLEPEKKRHKLGLKKDLNGMSKPSEKQGESKDENLNHKKDASSIDSMSPSMEFDEPPIHFDGKEQLSPEEAQMFELENQQLYEEMNSMMDEVKQIEGKVVEISRLQEVFADKVLEQECDINRIADTVVGTTENIKEANEEIREAMKNNAGMRVWILFILIICSFSLLFLDWYNI